MSLNDPNLPTDDAKEPPREVVFVLRAELDQPDEIATMLAGLDEIDGVRRSWGWLAVDAPARAVLAVADTGYVSAEVEEVTKLFHDTYEKLAPQFSYQTREASAKPWADVPEQNKNLMRATVATVLAALGQ